MTLELPLASIFKRIQIRREKLIDRNNFKLSGFTLVEILVVMVVIGIMAGMVALSVGGNPQRLLQQEARRLVLVLNAAADEALLQGRDFGLRVNSDSYQVLEFNRQQRSWVSAEQKMFALHQLPDAMSLALRLEDEPLDLTGQTEEEKKQRTADTDNEESPRILFFSSGEGMAYSLTLSHKEVPAATELVTDGVEDVHFAHR